jgi:hypothetical protein
LLVKCSIWEDHQFTRACEPVNNELDNKNDIEEQMALKTFFLILVITTLLGCTQGCADPLSRCWSFTRDF